MRRFDHGLLLRDQKSLWTEYCGFLDFSIEQFMAVQERLLLEQLTLLDESGLGRRFFGAKTPKSMDEFRSTVPLTTYADYSSLLANKREDLLPQKPAVWIRSAWEGSRHQVRYAPYTPAMLECYRKNLIAAMVLSASDKRGKTALRPHDSILCGMPPLPYETGLLPHVLGGALDVIPPVKALDSMSVAQAADLGIRLGMKNGIDLFFGMASFACRLGENFTLLNAPEDEQGVDDLSPRMMARMVKAMAKAKAERRKVKPADAFSLKGLIITGTDSAFYKERIKDQWGIVPHEVTGSAESTIVGTETWARNGLVFFPDSNFYEFVPEADMVKSLEDPAYTPRTVLMNELKAGERYELVLTTLHGGAFVRYRLGDMYLCLRERDGKNGIDLPMMCYMDRTPDVIDIAGFTRITKETIDEALTLSRLGISRYFALKEYDEKRRPYLHLYVEVEKDAMYESGATEHLIREQMSIYFKYLESEYGDLKGLLGMDPLKVEILPAGSIQEYEKASGRRMRKVNPPRIDVIELLQRIRPTTFMH
ncbi:MAG: auxin-responsive protein [Christensenellales bacterium]|jgi:hypothetical protein